MEPDHSTCHLHSPRELALNQQILVFSYLVKREQRGHEASSSERFAVVINRYMIISADVCV